MLTGTVLRRQPGVPVISCWDERNNTFTDVLNVHMYNSDFAAWYAEAARCGAVILPGHAGCTLQSRSMEITSRGGPPDSPPPRASQIMMRSCPIAPTHQIGPHIRGALTSVPTSHMCRSDEVFAECPAGAANGTDCIRGAVVTEAGARWFEGMVGDSGSPLTVLNWLTALRAGGGPFVPGVMLAWELMVRN